MTKPTAVEVAERIVADLEVKQAACVERGLALGVERTGVSFAAHAENDAKARARLDQLNIEVATHASELASIDAALAAAHARLHQARTAERNAAAIADAKAIRHEWSGARQDLADIDTALAQATEAAHRFYERCAAIQSRGAKVPPQAPIMIVEAFVARLMDLPKPLWRQFNSIGLEHLPPGRHRTALSLHATWAAQVENQATALAGAPHEQTDKPEAA